MTDRREEPVEDRLPYSMLGREGCRRCAVVVFDIIDRSWAYFFVFIDGRAGSDLYVCAINTLKLIWKPFDCRSPYLRDVITSLW
jgi:hypothetical protein